MTKPWKPVGGGGCEVFFLDFFFGLNWGLFTLIVMDEVGR